MVPTLKPILSLACYKTVFVPVGDARCGIDLVRVTFNLYYTKGAVARRHMINVSREQPGVHQYSPRANFSAGTRRSNLPTENV